MLTDPEMFETVENALRENGQIERFEKENGKIKGRMMITLAEIPEGIEVKPDGDKVPRAFEASFDFYDSVIGIAMYTAERKAASGLWVTPQKEGAEKPSKDWMIFFIQTLVKHLGEDGTWGVPIYSFVNDTCDMTVVPHL
ncbi:MAG: hypothetical protein ILO36_02605 [Abditibacteriota bacterium]|nr:hypothetical protein [Abditibacteriota bacterium]